MSPFEATFRTGSLAFERKMRREYEIGIGSFDRWIDIIRLSSCEDIMNSKIFRFFSLSLSLESQKNPFGFM